MKLLLVIALLMATPLFADDGGAFGAGYAGEAFGYALAKKAFRLSDFEAKLFSVAANAMIDLSFQAMQRPQDWSDHTLFMNGVGVIGALITIDLGGF